MSTFSRLIAMALAVSLTASEKAQTAPVSDYAEVEARSSNPLGPGAHGTYDPHVRLTAEQHIQVALQHRDAGRYTQAIEVLDMAIQRNSHHADLFTIRGSLYLEQSRFSEAMNDLARAVELEPDNAMALNNRAQVYRQFGRIADALKDLNRAIELEPDLLAARFNRGAIRFSSGDYEQALEDFQRCIDDEPQTAAPYFNRAATYSALGQQQKAIADLKQFMALSDSDAWKKTAQELLDKWEKQSSQTKNAANG